MAQESEKSVDEVIADFTECIDGGVEQAFNSKITCPECSKEITVSRAAIFRDNKLTMTITVEDGHMLQAETIGGTMIEFAKMMKARARDMGVKIEVMIPDLRFSAKNIAIDFMSVKLPNKEKSRA